VQINQIVINNFKETANTAAKTDAAATAESKEEFQE
jgi:hypothetical protein